MIDRELKFTVPEVERRFEPIQEVIDGSLNKWLDEISVIPYYLVKPWRAEEAERMIRSRRTGKTRLSIPDYGMGWGKFLDSSKGGEKMTGRMCKVFIVTKGVYDRETEETSASTIVHETPFFILEGTQEEKMVELGAEHQDKIQEAGGFQAVEFQFHYPS